MREIYIYLLIFVLLYLIYKRNYMFFDTYVDYPFYTPRSNTSNGKIVNNVPLKIFLTWETKKLPINMANNITLLQKMNPEFDIYLYDDQDRIDFLKNNFKQDVLDAYNSLIPGSYRADLWRYAIIYKYGGVYIDIKYHTYIPLIDLIKENEFTFTNTNSGLCKDSYDGKEIQSTFYISSPNNKIFIDSINEIITKTENKDYGQNRIDITGPCVLTRNINKIYGKDFDKNVTLTYTFRNTDNVVSISKRNSNILVASSYIEYRNDQKYYFKNNNLDDYHDAYKNKTVFK